MPPVMPRLARQGVNTLIGAATLLGTTVTSAPVVGTATIGAVALSSSALAQPSSQPALSVEQARAAANRIMAAEQRKDANARFSQFSPDLQQITSPAMIAETMAKRGAIRSWKLLSVQSGVNQTTVEVEVIGSRGQQDIFIVLNQAGQLMGYYVDRTDEAPSKVAGQFVRALSAGHYITARSFLSPTLQKQVSAADLQARWQNLQRATGNFVKVNRVIEAGQDGEQRLVLVNTTFNRLTDNLFVLLDPNNLIFNVDFPNEPAKPR